MTEKEIYYLVGQSYKKIIIKLLCLSLISLTACDFSFLYKNGEKETDTSYDLANGPDTLEAPEDMILKEDVYVDFSAPYATFSIINDGHATLYKHSGGIFTSKWNGVTIAINAGHGTKGGSKIKTFSHPDFTPKVSGGTTKKGEILSSAVSEGTMLNGGISEADVNLMIAVRVKEKLLDAGYNVLMIREDDDLRLDNIARTVIADTNADLHIAIHFDSTDTDKGIFYIAPYNDESYLSMMPLRDNAKNINDFGHAMIEAYRDMGEKIWKDKGVLQGDLTQISYSRKPSIDIELGDKATIIDDEKIEKLAEGMLRGINSFCISREMINTENE